MRKRITLLRRRSDLSREDFRAHWRAGHASIVLGLPGVRRYTQNHFVGEGASAPAVDGIVELWYDDGDGVIGTTSHHSPDQVADELAFLSGLTGFVVRPATRHPESPWKVWLLAGRPVLGADLVRLLGSDAVQVVVEERDMAAGVMSRERLQTERRPPRQVVSAGFADVERAREAYERLRPLAEWAGDVRVLLSETNVIL